MLTLGLDPSLRAYGWAVYDSNAANSKNRRVASGHEGTLSLTVPVARFMHFRALVKDLLNRYSIQAVGIESPAYGGGHFSEQHFGLMMFSLEAVFEKRIDCVLFDPTTLKFMTTGKANAGKLDMQRFVQLNIMSTTILQNDEADAFCVARATARFMEIQNGTMPVGELSDHEKKVFLTRTRKKKTATGTKIVKRTAHVFRENSRYFSFSKVPAGDVTLPSKSMINTDLLNWLEENNG
jgi:Holliday junction resolvasome RuvABC endonuclease subunit